MSSRFDDLVGEEQKGLTGILPQCLGCAWLNPDDTGKCKAFPDGIPLPIRLNQFDHRKPISGDNGFQFFPKSMATEHPMRRTDKAPDG